jgi:SagB-type dehydrogenase family enzyme
MAQFTNRHIEVAREFHESTKHSYMSVRTRPHFLDWGNRPMPYKIYPGAGTIALPRDLNLWALPTQAAMHQRQPTREAELTVDTMTRLLFCADGLTKRAIVDGEEYHFRAAASAGALYPVELYLAASEVDGLEPGLYHFLPADLKLHGLRRGDWRMYLARTAALHPSILQAQAILIITAIFWRSAWKYRARAYRYCFWDTGTILANLLATANAQGLNSEVVTAFDDAQLEELLHVDGDHEGLACLVALGRTETPAVQSPVLQPFELESIPLSQREVVYEEIVHIHRASRLTTSEEVREVGGAQLAPWRPEDTSVQVRLEPEQAESELGLGETILRRGSTRVFAREPLAGDEFAAILDASGLPASASPQGLCETYVIVNAVDGIDPGAYYHNRQTRTLDLLKTGDFRREAGYLSLEQPLGIDCSALLIYMTDLEKVLQTLGNRGYRDVHLEAGLRGGRAYLAAYSLQRGATGLTFYDDDTTRFLQPHCGAMSPLLMVAVGVPQTRRNQDQIA